MRPDRRISRAGGPSKTTWRRALGWQQLLFVQVGLAIVYATVLSGLTCLCIDGVEVLLRHLTVGDPWVGALKGLKALGFVVMFAVALSFELVHLKSAHFPRGRDESARR